MMPPVDELPPAEFHRSTRIVVLVAFLVGLCALIVGAWKWLRWLT